jgi:hypothetical protein
MVLDMVCGSGGEVHEVAFAYRVSNTSIDGLPLPLKDVDDLLLFRELGLPGRAFRFYGKDTKASDARADIGCLRR